MIEVIELFLQKQRRKIRSDHIKIDNKLPSSCACTSNPEKYDELYLDETTS